MKVHIFNHWFKFKVPVDKHSEAIVDSMQRAGHRWPDKSKTYMRNHFWDYVNHMGAGQYYNWREGRNYLCFNSEEEYLVFLLKL